MRYRNRLLTGTILAARSFRREGEEKGTEGGTDGLTNLPGGGLRFAPSGDIEGQQRKEAEAAGGTSEPNPNAPPEQKLPEGYTDWAEYGRDVASGKVKPAGAEEAPKEETPAEGALTAEQQAGVEQDLSQLPDDRREAAKPFFEEFAKTGALTEESVKGAATAFGVTEDMVRQYVAGAQATQSLAATEFHSLAGGADQYAQFQEWSKTGMDEATAERINKALDTNPDLAKELISGQIAAWKEGGGAAPRDLTKGLGGNATSAAVTGYESMYQQKQDQADPRYAQDPAFRAMVEKKIALSNY